MRTLTPTILFFLASRIAVAVDSPPISARLQDANGRAIPGKTVVFTAYRDGQRYSEYLHARAVTGADGSFTIPPQNLGDTGWIFDSDVPEQDRYELCVEGLTHDQPGYLNSRRFVYCPVLDLYDTEGHVDFRATLEKLGSVRSLTYLSIQADHAYIPILPVEYASIQDLSNNDASRCQIKDASTGEKYGAVVHHDDRDLVPDNLTISNGKAWLCGTTAESPSLQIDGVVADLVTPVRLVLSADLDTYTRNQRSADLEVAIHIELPDSPTLAQEIEALSQYWHWVNYDDHQYYSLQLKYPENLTLNPASDLPRHRPR